jgi:hypothetical protein
MSPCQSVTSSFPLLSIVLTPQMMISSNYFDSSVITVIIGDLGYEFEGTSLGLHYLNY